MEMKIYQFTIVLLFTCLSVSAQNFLPGKVIINSEDIRQGFVQDIGIKKMSETCNFKETLDSKDILTFWAADIEGYEVNDKVFRSKTFAKASGKQINSFVLQLVGGKVSLYKYNGLLLAEKNDQITLLSRKDSIVTIATPSTSKYIFTSSGTRIVSERQHIRPVYIYQLNNLFVECANRHAFVNITTEYSLESMADVVIEYNKCVGELDYNYKKGSQ